MKIQNKKTGEIGQIGYVATQDGQIIVEDISGEEYPYSVICSYKTLAELNEDWEDYEPKEPLIKDEKVRKAVRAWAEACNLKHVTYKQASNEFYDADTRGAFAIKFTLMPVEVYLEDGESFTIAELCGEEEE